MFVFSWCRKFDAGGEVGSSSEEEDDEDAPKPAGYYEEQEQIRHR